MIDCTICLRLKFGQIRKGICNICKPSGVRSSSAEWYPGQLADIVVHSENVEDIVKTFVPRSPYHLFTKDRFFCIKEKTILKMISIISSPLICSRAEVQTMCTKQVEVKE